MTNETLANGLSTVRSYQDTTGRLTAISSDLGGTGAYTYPPSGANSARPHAVTSVNGNIAGVVNPNYTYDANGNMITAFAGTRTITYASFNLPTQIARGGTAVSWVYDADHVRTKQSSNANMTGQAATVYYLNAGSQPLFEKHIGIVGTGLTEYRHFIGGVAVYTQKSNAIADTKYLLKDHLGSTTVVTNSAGVVLERYSYDPFGKTRNLNGSDIAYSATMPAPSVRRGFTDHEMLPEFAGGLIHMNGRIYDPNLGRFMTADFVIPNGEHTESYNRYSYVFNNPLSLTDPDGQCPVCAIVVVIIGGAATISVGYGVTAVVMSAFFGMMAAAVASEGDPKAMLQGAVSGALFAWIGGAIQPGAGAGGALTGGQIAAKIAVHAVAGGLINSAFGGDFRSGALAGGFGAAVGSMSGLQINEYSGWGQVIAVGVVRTVAGGIGAELGGGKFVNGAATAAFAYLFNDVRGQTAKMLAQVRIAVKFLFVNGKIERNGERSDGGLK